MNSNKPRVRRTYYEHQTLRTPFVSKENHTYAGTLRVQYYAIKTETYTHKGHFGPQFTHIPADPQHLLAVRVFLSLDISFLPQDLFLRAWV